MGKLYVPSQLHTSVDHVRKDLDRAEGAIASLKGAGSEAVQILHLFDKIERELHALEQRDADPRVEQTRFETVQRQLKRHRGRFLKEAGRALRQARAEVEPPRSRWWWYLDEAAARQRRRRWRRLGAGAAAVLVLLTGLWFAYREFLAPPPEVSKAFRHIQAGKSEVERGSLGAALEDFDAATTLMPDDPEPWLWKGLLHDLLGEAAKAEDAFAEAESRYESRSTFIVNRGRVYFQSGDIEKAKADVETAIDMDPTSGWAHYLLAGILADEGDYDTALAELARTRELARMNGNGRLEALAANQQARLLQMQPMSTPE